MADEPHVIIARSHVVRDGRVVASDFAAVPPGDVVGAQGEQGERGPRGLQGEDGPVGPRGVQGQKGDKGDTGDTGATGPQGFRGLIGATGSRGAQGLKGDTGDRGPRGVAGAAGADGPEGPQGDPGIQGPQGDPGAAGGAPVDATYLTTVANGDLTSEVVVGATPGGELGGTWAAPTVDATHSGSTHAAAQAAAEATAAAALTAHTGDATDAHDASAVSILDTANDFTATDVEGALAELQSDAESHSAAADPHPGYLTPAEHTAVANAAPHHAEAHTLTSHSSRAHSELTGVGATDHHTNANDPSAGQKAALAGTDGTPGAGNPYVTDSDARLAGTGVTDHGALTGLADDDHPQYTTDAEATAIADTEAAAAVVTHEAAADPHPTYLTAAEHTAVGDAAPHHAAVTLAADADVLLGLTGQQVTLDSQVANTVLAGPTNGADADPTFRALVDADIPAAIARDTEVATAVTNHEAAADPHAGYLKESDFGGVDFLVGTATGITANEIAVGVTPGGELGNTWASPTVDASHSGSTHAATQAAAEATAAGALATHVADADPHAGYLKESDYNAKGDLISASANDTPSTVTAGANDTMLMADSAATAGLKWAAPAVPSTQAFGDVAAEGTGDTFTRGDHKHGMPAAPAAERAAASTAPAAIGTAAVGVGVTDARADHVHATGAGVPSTQAFGDVAAAGAGPAAAMTDHKHAMMADPVTAHAAAADPHAGYVLESLLDAKGDLIVASADNTPAKVTVGANDTILMADSAAGAGVKWVAPAAPVAVGTANAEGATDDFARASHVHAHEVAHVAHDTVWDAKGDIVAGTAADTAAVLTVGANDTILMADSAAATGLKWVAAAVPSTQALGDAAAEGTADTFTRGDHKHAMPNSTAGPDADIAIDAAGAAGTASTAARAAHGHKLATSATAGAAIGTAAAGTSGHAPSRDDHVHPTGAGAPTASALADAAAAGAGPAAAMTNHVHGRESAATQAQQETGTDLTSPVTPGRQQFHPSAAKCWGATTGGGTPSLTAGSYNVTSIADTATGRMTVTIGTDFSSASFVGQVTGTAATATLKLYGMVTKAAGTVILESGTAATTLADVGVGFDWAFYGDQ